MSLKQRKKNQECDGRDESNPLSSCYFSMTVHVPGASVIVRKPRWKQLLPEIPATRLACLTSGSFRPKLGFGILFLLLIGCIVLVLIPLFITPTLSPFLAGSSAA